MMLDKSLWERSGHWEHYKEHMFLTASENREYAIKPMNCPGHVQVFNGKLRSYKDLPLRLGEFGSCHRNEPSGLFMACFVSEISRKTMAIYFVLKIRFRRKYFSLPVN